MLWGSNFGVQNVSYIDLKIDYTALGDRGVIFPNLIDAVIMLDDSIYTV